MRPLKIVTVLFVLYAFFAVAGCDTEADDTGNQTLTGCDPVTAFASCSIDLSSRNFGSGDQSLGWANIDGQCQEVIGSKQGNACLFASEKSCAESCIATSSCFEEAFRANRNPGWPREVGTVYDAEEEPNAICDRIYVCYDEEGSTTIGNLIQGDEVAVNVLALEACPAGTVPYELLELSGWGTKLNEERWDKLCGYSVLAGTAELRCYR